SSDFPTLNAIDGSLSGWGDAFVTKINAAGTSLGYSTYLGGGSYEEGHGIAVDSSGAAYITGYTYSSDFPTRNPIYGSRGNDAFVTKIAAAGDTLVYSTYLGGGGGESGNGIAVDSTGAAYITGTTVSTDFPTQNAIYGSLSGSTNLFVTKIDATGSGLVYSTYLGGSDGSDSGGVAIAVDYSGAAYITGFTFSTDFPTRNAIYSSYSGDTGTDVFVTKINAAGSGLDYSTYLGGTGDDGGSGIAVDSSGAAYITGTTNSGDFPTQNAIYGSYSGGSNSWERGDAFVTKINAAGSALSYSTYLGGSSSEGGSGIAVDSSGAAYITGSTRSSDFPTQSPIYGAKSGWQDAFVTKINAAGSALAYSTYLGGSSSNYGKAIAVDSSGAAYITGQTSSSDFPTLNAIDGSLSGWG
ncbi:MAG: SBBP repeat-containing protein, partial [bacterium]|nr:SBBP repeat-containing protein [bacterium]